MRTPSWQEAADREAIREVANRYCHGIDRLDAGRMKSAYWPEAIDDHGVFVGNAWEFVDRVTASHAKWAWTMHATTNHHIELADDGVSAAGELYNVSTLMSADRSTVSTWHGRYLDRYEKRGDEWRIIHRTCVHEGTELRPVERTMTIDTTLFRQGSEDRHGVSHPAGEHMSERWITDSNTSERFPFYSRANTGEIAPFPMSPLCWRIVWERGTNPGYSDGYVRWGSHTPDELTGDNTPFACFGGYVYHNWSLVRLMGERSPGMSAQLMDDAFFGGISDVPPYEPHPDDERPDLNERVQHTMDTLLGAERLPDELDDDRAKALANRAARPDLSTATDLELVQRAIAMSPMIAEFFDPYAIYGTASSFAFGMMATVCAGLDPALPGRLLSGVGDVDSVPPSLAIWDLSRLVASSPSLTAAFDAGLDGLRDRLADADGGAAFVDALASVCREHGARGPIEWDVMSASWETDPGLVLTLVDRLRFAGDDQSPEARRARIAADRAEAEAEVRAHLAGNADALGTLELAMHLTSMYVPGRERTKLTEMMTVHEVRVAIHELGRRMTERGVVDAPDRVFMLLDIELEAFVADPGSFADIIRERHARFVELAAKQEPLNIFRDAPDTDAWPQRSAAAEPLAVGDVLTGVAGGPGKVVGRARVIHDPGDPRGLEPGDILVASVTDPAWTPLFMSAGGVVVELGAPMSHAMIVSRELGVPCVTSVKHAARRIKDGMLLEVDGGKGTVTILE